VARWKPTAQGRAGVGRGDSVQADRAQVCEQAAETVHGQGGRVCLVAALARAPGERTGRPGQSGRPGQFTYRRWCAAGVRGGARMCS
jgi:hypothetical protein